MDVIIDKAKFLEDLDLHMAQIGRPIGKSPIMGYKELNLHQLFCEVIAFGGFEEVVKKVGTWARMWKRLDNFDPSVTDASFRLRKNYERCLLDYEMRRFPDHRMFSAESLSEIQNRLNTDQKVNIQRKRSSTKNARNSIRSHSRKNSTEESQSSALNPHNIPIIVDDFIVESFGAVIPLPHFVSAKCLYPLGFKSCRNFWSMKNPNQLTKYTSQIVQSELKDENDYPLPAFLVSTEDDPYNIIRGETPSKVWKIVFKRVFGDSKYYDNEANGLMNTRLRVKKDIVSGNGQFGLTNQTVLNTLKELPNAPEAFKLLNQAKKKKRKSKALSSGDEDSDDSKKNAKQRNGDNESNDESSSIGSGDDSMMSRSSSCSSLISNLELNDDDDFELDFASQTISSFKLRINCSTQMSYFDQLPNDQSFAYQLESIK